MASRPLRSALRVAAAALALALAPPASAQATYVVRPGDTLYGISRTTGVGVPELRRLNALDGDLIEVGQVLRLRAGAVGAPPPVSTGGGRTVHVVQPGETLYSIATRYGATVDELRRINGIVGTYIASGQRLTVPAGGAPPTGTPPPATPPVTTLPPPTTPAPAPETPPVAAPVASTEPPAVSPLTLGPWRIDATTVPADLVHFVDPGETLYSIAVRYGFSVEQLAAINELTTAPLAPGTLLVMPAPVDPSVPHEVVLPPADTTGLALVYDDAFTGRLTASAEPYAPAALTAAHRTLPLGTILLVTNTVSGRSVFVRVNDRGPISTSYLVELSAAAAAALDLDPNAARRVELRWLR